MEERQTLVVDVGGTHIKVISTGRRTPVKIDSGPDITAGAMAQRVKEAVAEWSYDRVSIGFPGPVVDDKPHAEPHNLGGGWVKFDYAGAFGKPVRMMNDAAMQALGSYNGGRMLFLGLGTGLGSAMIIDGTVVPLELAHLPYRRGKTYEEYVGLTGLERLGKKRWRKAVFDVVELLQRAFQTEYLVLGGGNAKHLKELPENSSLGANGNAFLGGYKLWELPELRSTRGGHKHPAEPKAASSGAL